MADDKLWSFYEHVTEAISQGRPGDPRQPTLWPSEATCVVTDKNGNDKVVGKCRRAAFFRYVKSFTDFFTEEVPNYRPILDELNRFKVGVSPYMRFIWAQGELYEDYLIGVAKTSGVFKTEQAPIYIRKYNVSGKRDIEVVNPKTGKLSILEVKSVYGFGANSALGTESARRRGLLGEPRESNLMQIALYHWWAASADEAYEESRLCYGARDTGRFAEYQVKTEVDPNDNRIYVWYRGVFPNLCPWVKTSITIDSILKQYEFIAESVAQGIIPDRDYSKKYTNEDIERMYRSGELTAKEAETYEKVRDRNDFNRWIESLPGLSDEEVVDSATIRYDDLAASTRKALDGDDEAKAVKAVRKLKTKAVLKGLTKGDWQCRFCDSKDVCYDAEDKPRDLSHLVIAKEGSEDDE